MMTAFGEAKTKLLYRGRLHGDILVLFRFVSVNVGVCFLGAKVSEQNHCSDFLLWSADLGRTLSSPEGRRDGIIYQIPYPLCMPLAYGEGAGL